MNHAGLTYDVRIWRIEKLTGKTGTTYRLRWRAGQQRFSRVFSKKNLAEAFRSRLVAAASGGEAFQELDGLPVSMARSVQQTSCTSSRVATSI